MSKKLVSGTGEVLSSVPKIKSVRPAGTCVLVEVLTAQEALGTILSVQGNVVNGAPQGYIKDIGPNVDLSKFGYKKGDRVILQGNFTPLPEGESLPRENQHRPLILVEPHQIKAVLEE